MVSDGVLHLCMLANFACFLSSADILTIRLLKVFEMLGLIWVQLFAKHQISTVLDLGLVFTTSLGPRASTKVEPMQVLLSPRKFPN